MDAVYVVYDLQKPPAANRMHAGALSDDAGLAVYPHENWLAKELSSGAEQSELIPVCRHWSGYHQLVFPSSIELDRTAMSSLLDLKNGTESPRLRTSDCKPRQVGQ